jgi:hypothetical protein
VNVDLVEWQRWQEAHLVKDAAVHLQLRH